MEQTSIRSLNLRLLTLILISLTIALSAISYAALRSFEVQLVPEISAKAEDVGRSVATLVDRTTSYGIDVRHIVGVEQLFADTQNDNHEFASMGLYDASGALVTERGGAPGGLSTITTAGTRQAGSQYVVALPITRGGLAVGWLAIGIPVSYVDDQMREVLLDLAAVLVVALFLTYELLYFIAGSRLAGQMSAFGDVVGAAQEGDLSGRTGMGANDEVGVMLGMVDAALDRINALHETVVARIAEASRSADAAIRARAARASEALEPLRAGFAFGRRIVSEERGDAFLGLIRTPLFLFIFAEELSRSFLPLYTKELATGVTWISPQLVVGLPIMLFMFVVALSQPVIGLWSERVGRRYALLVGALVGLFGFAMTAFAHSLPDLLVWRSLTAVGYGLIFGAAQGYVLDNTDAHNRTRGLALFIGAIMVAATCGPSIGGILADRIGFRWTFGVSAILVLASLAVIWFRLPRQAPTTDTPRVGMREMRILLGNPRFLVLMLSASVPAKIILTAYAFYLVPLYITSAGSNPSTTGRLLMLYAIMMVFFTPVAAQISDRVGKRPIFVAVGLALSALGGLLFPAAASVPMVLAIVILLGLGQAISIAPQSALVGELVYREKIPLSESAAYGVFRLVERLGNTAGPFVAAIVLAKTGFSMAFFWIGAFVLLCSLIFAITMRTAHFDEIPVGLSAEQMGIAS